MTEPRAAIRWTEELAVGIESIDSQHREMFATAGSLIEAVRNGGGPAEIVEVLAFLDGYVRNHFALEELYMKRYHFPSYPSHKAEHTAFIGDLYDLHDEFDRGGATVELAVRLARRVGNWLADHILRQDKVLAAFLRSAR